MKLISKHLLLILLVVSSGLLATTCDNGSYKKGSESIAYEDAGFSETDESLKQKGDYSKSKPANENNAPAKESYERKLIKRGNLRFETKNIDKTAEQIKVAVEQLNGYVSNENQSNYANSKSQTLEIRVPSENFDALIAEISKGVKYFDSKNITVKDVSEEFYDIQARLKTKKEIEANYLELLKKAKSVEDILTVERELGVIRTDIESMEGRLRFLSNQVSLSTLSVSFYETSHTKIGFLHELGNSVKQGWKGLLDFLVGLVSIWPAILIIGIIVFLLIRFERKRKRRKQNKN